MCGIFGINSNKSNACETILQALSRLEYRGYDSAGITLLDETQFQTKKVIGRISELTHTYTLTPNKTAKIGIGHTRWATHGKPTLENAHPIITKHVAVAHNGIIENHDVLRKELIAAGYIFMGDTDTEVIPNLIELYLSQGLDNFSALQAALKRLEGAFALLIIFNQQNSEVFAAKNGAPLAIGIAEGSMFVSSDSSALAPFANHMIYLEDGDLALLTADDYKIYHHGQEIKRQAIAVDSDSIEQSKGKFAHFMLKEIHDQPAIISGILNEYIKDGEIIFPEVKKLDWNTVQNITIVACGTSYYAGLTAKYWLEEIARIPTNVDLASEYRYRSPSIGPQTLLIFISQSGETADTFAALKMAASHSNKTLGIINVKQSSIANLANNVIYTNAGNEIGVASTKAFTAQLTVLALLALKFAHKHKQITNNNIVQYINSLQKLPLAIESILRSNNIEAVARKIHQASHFLFAGRGVSYPIAMEGSLKTKELSYIPAEGLALGELKHGTLALVDDKCHVIICAPYNNLFTKTLSNIQEIKARDGKVIVITNQEGAALLSELYNEVIIVDYLDNSNLITPFISVLPLQLLAYYLALVNNKDIDKPRNLSKSVTVE